MSFGQLFPLFGLLICDCLLNMYYLLDLVLVK